MKSNLLYIILAAMVAFCSCTTQQKKNMDGQKIKKILILGNSIVIHEPAPNIGWHHNWGMAASTRDSDFVHILSSNIHKIDTAVIIQWGNLSAYENNYGTHDLNELADYRNFKPDMLILKISENVKYEEGMNLEFTDSYDKLLKYLAPSDSTAKIIVEGFWPTPVNDMIKRYAEKNNYIFIPLSDLYENDKTNTAIGLFEHEGVGRHPSDKGMRNIADRIWVKISAFFSE
jgi:hypothetical protein